MENRVKVRILGRDYTLGTDNTPEYTLKLAQKLDGRMNEMLASTKTLSGMDVAILCALDSMDEAEKATANADNIRLQLGEYVTSADKAQTSYENAKREIQSLKRRIQELEERLNNKNYF